MACPYLPCPVLSIAAVGSDTTAVLLYECFVLTGRHLFNGLFARTAWGNWHFDTAGWVAGRASGL